MQIIEQPHFNSLDAAPPLAFGATNYGSSNIPHGSLVAWDEAITNSDAAIQRARRSRGIAVPASANMHRLCGIVSAADKRNIHTDEDGAVVAGGLCQALVYVPASTQLTEGDLLMPRTSRGTAPTTSPTFATSLEALILKSTVLSPPNPYAILRETLASGSARTVLAWVEVIPLHRPLPFTRSLYLADATGNPDEILMGLLAGPGVMHYIIAGLQVAVTTSGNLTVNAQTAPLGTTADVQALYTTALQFDDAGSPSAGAVAGPAGGASTSGLAGEDGDTDTGNVLGTSGSNGVRAALAVRQFNAPSLLTVTLGGTPGGGATGLTVEASGWFY